MPGPGREEEALPLRNREPLAAVVELVLDLSVEHVAAVPVGAPLLASRARLVFDDRPALPERLGSTGVDVRLVVLPADRVEVEPPSGAHAGILPEAPRRRSRNST